MKHYFILDVETGGLTTKQSLLSLYCAHLNLVVCNVGTESSRLGLSINSNRTLELLIKPNDHTQYVIDPQALGINRINLTEHDKNPLTKPYSESRHILKEFIYSCMDGISHNSRATLVGYNIGFDKDFLLEHLFEGNREEFGEWFDYGMLDVKAIAVNAQVLGLLPADMNLKLTNVAEFFGIDTNGAHDAKIDCNLTVDVLNKLNQLTISI